MFTFIYLCCPQITGKLLNMNLHNNLDNQGLTSLTATKSCNVFVRSTKRGLR